MKKRLLAGILTITVLMNVFPIPTLAVVGDFAMIRCAKRQ